MEVASLVQKFELAAGDQLVCNTRMGDLFILKASGGEVNLNELSAGSSAASREMLGRSLNPESFMQLAGILAGLQGLVARLVKLAAYTFTCQFEQPSMKPADE